MNLIAGIWLGPAQGEQLWPSDLKPAKALLHNRAANDSCSLICNSRLISREQDKDVSEHAQTSAGHSGGCSLF